MKVQAMKIATVVFALAMLAGCVTGPPGPYYSVQEQPTPQGGGILSVGPEDHYFALQMEDRTPFGLQGMPQAMNLLYSKGYDQVRRQREADFALNMSFTAMSRDNPDARAGHAIGGALLGAATGAIIGGALGSPGKGAAIGAGSGAALGLIAPADAAMVRIDIRTESYRNGSTSYKSALVDLANVPPYDVQHVIDMQVARMLDTLPGAR
jgi:hypothetical protein